MERISGPFEGYCIAAYTVESGNGFVGFAKICLARPESPHGVNAQHKVRSYHIYSSEHQALESAEFRARETIAGMEPNWHPFSVESMMDSLRK